jgi:anti-sigma factor RsiW
MNMKCETARTLLVSLADREPVGPRAGELMRHLEQCAECRALLEALRQDRETLRGMPAPEPPERLLGRVMTQVQGLPQGFVPRNPGLSQVGPLGTAPEFPRRNSGLPPFPFRKRGAVPGVSLAVPGLRVAAIILLFLAGIALGVVIGYTISPKDTHPIDRIAVLMMSEPTENQSEVQ